MSGGAFEQLVDADAAVEALAHELHQLQCVLLRGQGGGIDLLGTHRAADRAKARFLLLGLVARGYQVRAVDGPDRLRFKALYTVPGLDGTWRLMGLETEGMGADGRAMLRLHREEPDVAVPDPDVPGTYDAPSTSDGERDDQPPD